MSARVVEARRLLREAQCDAPGKPLYRSDSDAIAAAQTLATLEIAEQTANLAQQQQIANLIALGIAHSSAGCDPLQFVTSPGGGFTPEIKKGLGL